MINELREELNVAKLYDLTPRQYGLKIRNHPGNLLITAQNKMRTGTNVRMSVNYSASLVETNQLSVKTDNLQNNRDCVDQLLLTLEDPKIDAGGYLWTDIPVQKILDLIIPFHSPSEDNKYVRGYIQSGIDEELIKWDIFLAAKGRSSEYKVANKFKIDKQQRTIQTSPEKDILSFEDGGARIVRIWDEKIGLSKAELAKADHDQAGSLIAQTSRFYRQHRSKPLLVIKVIDVESVNKDLKKDLYENIYAYGISFPVSPLDRSLEYIYTKSATNN